jgi:hypothetical protein
MKYNKPQILQTRKASASIKSDMTKPGIQPDSTNVTNVAYQADE